MSEERIAPDKARNISAASEERFIASTAEFASTASRATIFWTNVFQALLVSAVVLWVLDVPRQVFNISFYTEQLLTVCLGLTLALAFIADTSRPRRWSDWVAVVLSLLLCGYITVRYEALTYELASLPVEGIIGSAVLTVLVLDASRRTSGWGFVGIILAMAVYVYVSPFLPGDFQTRWVSPQRMVAYVGLDVNGMIGSILAVAVLVVIPFTILGQVLARTGGAEFFSDLAMSAMGTFRGGAAKIAVVGSALFGMISGSAVSNVLAVGIVTIPTMIKSGFTPYRAAAIELVGSTGGPADAAGDGRCRLHHGGVPAGFLRRGLHRGRDSGRALLRLSVHPCRSRGRQARHRLGPDQGCAHARRGDQIGLALPGADHLPRRRADLSRSLPADAGKGRDRRHRPPDRAGARLRLSRQARHRRAKSSWR